MNATTESTTALNLNRPGAWGVIARIALIMLCIQAARAALTVPLYAWLRPGPTSPLWNWIDLAAFSIVGLALLAIYRPSAAVLGLEWHGMSRLARGLSTGSCGLALLLILTSVSFSPAILLENIKNALVLPLFEELLFRGWIWNRLENAFKGKYAGAITWLVNAVLFALWHLGYFDVYLLKAFPASRGMDPIFFMAMKLAVTFVIGLMVGFLRWRSRRAYGSLALHALINLFGP